jgi:hypothetical protein
MRGETRTFYSKALSGYKEKVRVSVDPYDRTALPFLSDLAGEFIDVAEPWGVTHPNDTERLKQQPGTGKRATEAHRRAGEKRLKEGFGLIPEGVQVTKVTPQTRTAKRAEKAKRVYEMNRENDKLVQKDHEATGREGPAGNRGGHGRAVRRLCNPHGRHGNAIASGSPSTGGSMEGARFLRSSRVST